MSTQLWQDDIKKHSIWLTVEEELVVRKQLKSRNRATVRAAKDTLIRSCLAWAMKLAHKYEWMCEYLAVDFEDVISEANRALVEAANKYDPDAGVRFVTYCYRVIQSCIWRHIVVMAPGVMLPNDVARWKFSGAESRERIQQNWSDGRKADAANAAQRHSITAAFGREETKSMASLLIDEKHEGPVAQSCRNESIALIHWVLRYLPKRLSTVLRLRMEGVTLKEVGQHPDVGGVTKERVRQLETRAKKQAKEMIERKMKKSIR